jgi:hypothetical protein
MNLTMKSGPSPMQDRVMDHGYGLVGMGMGYRNGYGMVPRKSLLCCKRSHSLSFFFSSFSLQTKNTPPSLFKTVPAVIFFNEQSIFRRGGRWWHHRVGT